MTEQEAVIFIKNANEFSKKAICDLKKIKDKAKRVGKVGEYYENIENCYKEIEACEIAIKALEEIQQYRAVGRVNEFKALKENWLNKLDFLIEYRKIGTIEECREAVEKQKEKIADLSGDGYADGHLVYDTYECPNCGKYYELDYEEYDYCPNCGQHMKIELEGEEE